MLHAAWHVDILLLSKLAVVDHLPVKNSGISASVSSYFSRYQRLAHHKVVTAFLYDQDASTILAANLGSWHDKHKSLNRGRLPWKNSHVHSYHNPPLSLSMIRGASLFWNEVLDQNALALLDALGELRIGDGHHGLISLTQTSFWPKSFLFYYGSKVFTSHKMSKNPFIPLKRLRDPFKKLIPWRSMALATMKPHLLLIVSDQLEVLSSLQLLLGIVDLKATRQQTSGANIQTSSPNTKNRCWKFNFANSDFILIANFWPRLSPLAISHRYLEGSCANLRATGVHQDLQASLVQIMAQLKQVEIESMYLCIIMYHLHLNQFHLRFCASLQ